ncbi:hypothetical protein, partial [Escherichia coli]
IRAPRIRPLVVLFASVNTVKRGSQLRTEMCFSAKFFIKLLKLKWILSLRLKGKSLEKQSIPDCHKGVLTLILP